MTGCFKPLEGPFWGQNGAFKKDDSLLVFPFNHMLEFQDGKIEFDGCFGISRLEIVFQYFSNDLPALLHQVLLFTFILDTGKSLYIPRQLPDLGKGFNYGQGRPNCLLAFKDSGYHVQALFREGTWQLNFTAFY